MSAMLKGVQESGCTTECRQGSISKLWKSLTAFKKDKTGLLGSGRAQAALQMGTNSVLAPLEPEAQPRVFQCGDWLEWAFT